MTNSNWCVRVCVRNKVRLIWLMLANVCYFDISGGEDGQAVFVLSICTVVSGSVCNGHILVIYLCIDAILSVHW